MGGVCALAKHVGYIEFYMGLILHEVEIKMGELFKESNYD